MLFKLFSSQHAYTVHEPPNAPADRGDRAEALVFIRDGFSFAAFLLAPIWLLSKKIWLGFLGYLAAAAVFVILVGALGLDPRWLTYGFLALHLLVGFEADSLLRWSLDRKGWLLISSVTGTSFEECERRFFDRWLGTVPLVATGNMTPPGSPGGLTPDALGRSTPPPYTGDVMPPKRTGWRSGLTSTGRT